MPPNAALAPETETGPDPRPSASPLAIGPSLPLASGPASEPSENPTTPAAESAEATGAARVTGRVIYSGGGPAAQIRLTLIIDGGDVARNVTGTGGTFAFEGMPPGPARLELHDPRSIRPIDPVDITIVAPQTVVDDIVLTLPDGQISGFVMRGKEGAGAGLRVYLAPSRYVSGATEPLATESQAYGAFTFQNIGPGSFTLWAESDTEVSEKTTGVRVGHKDVRLYLKPAGTISGRVSSAAGAPVQNAIVRWMRYGAAKVNLMKIQNQRVRPDDAGQVVAAHGEYGDSFVIRGLKAGTYRLVTSDPAGEAAWLDNLELPEGGALSNLELRMRPGAEITGRIVDPGQAPIAGAFVMAGRLATATADGAGQFTLRGVVPGDAYRLRIRAPGYLSKRVPVTAGTAGGVTDLGNIELYPGREEDLRESAGPYTGIGAGLARAEGGFAVDRLFDNSPALQAGLQKGDVITAIDGRPVQGLDMKEAVARIRGEARTPVRLEITRNGVPQTVTVVRDTIEVKK